MDTIQHSAKFIRCIKITLNWIRLSDASLKFCISHGSLSQKNRQQHSIALKNFNQLHFNVDFILFNLNVSSMLNLHKIHCRLYTVKIPLSTRTVKLKRCATCSPFWTANDFNERNAQNSNAHCVYDAILLGLCSFRKLKAIPHSHLKKVYRQQRAWLQCQQAGLKVETQTEYCSID